MQINKELWIRIPKINRVVDFACMIGLDTKQSSYPDRRSNANQRVAEFYTLCLRAAVK